MMIELELPHHSHRALAESSRIRAQMTCINGASPEILSPDGSADGSADTRAQSEEATARRLAGAADGEGRYCAEGHCSTYRARGITVRSWRVLRNIQLRSGVQCEARRYMTRS